MQLHTVHINELVIPKNRQRREFKPEDTVQLANSISQNGLIQPIVIRRNEAGAMVLVAGERRIKAMTYVWEFGQKVRCGGEVFEEGTVPCLYLGELDPVDAFEVELEENIRRVDLTWQERATAISQLMALRSSQAINRSEPAPTTTEIATEIYGKTADESVYTGMVRKSLIVSAHLNDPDVAKAKSVEDAFKILKRKEEVKRNEALALELGPSFTAKVHTILQGDCLELTPNFPAGSFDVIITDPPYGIGADDYGDSGGRVGGPHEYDDSLENWAYLMRGLAVESFRLAKTMAHLYIFCDIDNFVTLKKMLDDAGWEVFRTPIIWHNPTAMRTPWPEHGPQRKYQLITYAIKGKRRVNQIAPDVVSYPSDDNLGHAAQKPVALYEDLLKRSTRPGDSVLDPFCGSGPVFPAAHNLKCKATGIELKASAYAVAAKRTEKLL